MQTACQGFYIYRSTGFIFLGECSNYLMEVTQDRILLVHALMWIYIKMHSHEQYGLAIVFKKLLKPDCAVISPITIRHGSPSLKVHGFPNSNGSPQHPTQPDHIVAARLPAGVVQIHDAYIDWQIIYKVCIKNAPKKLIQALTNLGTIFEVHLQLRDIFRKLGIASSKPIMSIVQLGAQPWEQ